LLLATLTGSGWVQVFGSGGHSNWTALAAFRSKL
jgi:hypothetical protein